MVTSDMSVFGRLVRGGHEKRRESGLAGDQFSTRQRYNPSNTVCVHCNALAHTYTRAPELTTALLEVIDAVTL